MVNEGTANLYLQLGIAGATLFILLVFVVLLFRMMGKVSSVESGSHNSRIDKLCDKIDSLISSNAEHTQKLNEVLLSNDKDQKTTISLLDRILDVATDNQRRITRIDDRTFRCLGNEKKEEELK